MSLDLNKSQQDAVEYTDGPLLIVAGAGTGKTTVVTQKIIHLIKSGLAKPEEILALTFTDNSAYEMQERVEEKLETGYVDMQISTFHSFCQRILEKYGLDIGVSNQFKLFTETDAWLMLREHIYEFDLDYYWPIASPTRYIKELLKHFSKCKDELISPEDYLGYAEELRLNNDEAGDNKSVKSKVKSQYPQGIPLRGKSEVDLNDAGDESAMEVKRLNEIANAYHKYNQLLLDNGALDFGDLIFYTVKLLQERPNILSALQKQFKYILVDEFQDVNWGQYILVKLISKTTGMRNLSKPETVALPMEYESKKKPVSKNRDTAEDAHSIDKKSSDAGFERSLHSPSGLGRDCVRQLTVVGDDDQSIYAFRGASVSNILRFKEDFTDSKEIVLNENYRSGQEILDGAYKLIQNNNPDRLEVKLKIDKRLKGKVESIKGKVEHLHFDSLDGEVAGVVKKISELLEDELVVLDDISILVRANSHADPFVNALEKAGIPYEFLASSGLFRQPLVLDSFNFLKVIDNYHDDIAIYRLVRLPFFDLKESDLQKFTHTAKKKSISYYEALKRAQEFEISKEGLIIMEKIITLIHNGMKKGRFEKPTTVLYNFFDESGYLQYLTQEEEKGNRKVIRSIYHLRQFFDFIARYEEAVSDAPVSHFVEYFENILASGDEGKLYQPTDTPDSVNIMTVHGSKGLEFKYVFLVNLVEERFPSRRRSDSIEIPLALINEQLPEGDIHYQEERRLFYVAMTRAKECLYLVSGEDYGGVRKKKISRFLVELEYDHNSTTAQQHNSTIGNSGSSLITSQSNEGKFQYELPKSFSFSQIRSYQTCPYQYKLSHILKIPTKGNSSFSFGDTMHKTLQKFYERMKELNNVSQTSLFEMPQAVEKIKDVTAPTMGELIAMYEESWIPDWYKNKKQREDYFEKGKEILKIFYISQKDNWIIPAVLEGWFRIKVGDYLVNGRIDRVDQLADGSLEIFDYKTGKGKEKLSSDDKDQLLIYQIAAQSLPEYKDLGNTSKLTFYYLNDNLQTSFLGTDKELEKINDKIIKTLDGIKSGDFVATPNKFTCEYCDYREICDYRV
ncbi:ATP-dependent helicase [Patescibacteria group bacterium]|nr:ATP-dependent helicase [Patescibacteria group bacterium]